MSREADVAKANIQLKRWAKVATEAGAVVGGANPEVRSSVLWPVSTRWRVYERMKLAFDAKPGEAVALDAIKDTEACVAAASTAVDVMIKYSYWARDKERSAQFQDRLLRGEQARPPPDPPEWAEDRRQKAEVAAEATQRTQEWVKTSARGWMKHYGFDDPVKFEAAWAQLQTMGVVK